MLTGDKVGTAINIARACNILSASARVLELTAESFPVLARLSTNEMLAAQHALKCAASAAERERLVLEQCARLDRLYPELLQVRQALLAHARQLGELASPSGPSAREGGGGRTSSTAWTADGAPGARPSGEWCKGKVR